MTRIKMACAVAFAGLVLAGADTELQAGWGIGVRIGGPVYYGPSAPYYYPYYPYGYPYGAVYAVPPPVVVESAPVSCPVPSQPSTGSSNTWHAADTASRSGAGFRGASRIPGATGTAGGYRLLPPAAGAPG